MVYETKFHTGQRLLEEVSLSVHRAHIHKHNNLTFLLPLEQIYDQFQKNNIIFLSMQIGVTGLRTPLYEVRACYSYGTFLLAILWLLLVRTNAGM